MMDKQVRNSLGSRAYFPFPMQALNFRKLNIERGQRMPRSKSQNALKSRKARRALPAGTAKPTVHAPRTLDALRRVGPRPNVI